MAWFITLIVLQGCLNITEADWTARFDNDNDGFSREEECDDEDPETYPGAPERCDEVDRDCNGIIDDNACVVFTRRAGPDEQRDLFISSLDGSDERQLTDTPDVSEDGAVPSPDRSVILYSVDGGERWWVDRFGSTSQHCLSVEESIEFENAGSRDYDRIDGVAWFQSDAIIVNRGITDPSNNNTSGNYLAELVAFDDGVCTSDHPMFTEVAISTALGGCCDHQVQIKHAFSSCPGDFVIRGMEQAWEPMSDLYRFRLSTWEFGPIHDDAANGDRDDYRDGGELRINNAEDAVAWSHNFVEGWNEGVDEDENDFWLVSKAGPE